MSGKINVWMKDQAILVPVDSATGGKHQIIQGLIELYYLANDPNRYFLGVSHAAEAGPGVVVLTRLAIRTIKGEIFPLEVLGQVSAEDQDRYNLPMEAVAATAGQWMPKDGVLEKVLADEAHVRDLKAEVAGLEPERD